MSTMCNIPSCSSKYAISDVWCHMMSHVSHATVENSHNLSLQTPHSHLYGLCQCCCWIFRALTLRYHLKERLSDTLLYERKYSWDGSVLGIFKWASLWNLFKGFPILCVRTLLGDKVLRDTAIQDQIIILDQVDAEDPLFHWTST